MAIALSMSFISRVVSRWNCSEELMRLQHELGFLDDESLRDVARRNHVPLYRIEGLVGFYPSFRRDPPRAVTIEVCRDVSCALAGGAEHLQELRERIGDRDDVEIREVSCLGRCDAAPAASIGDTPVAPCSLADRERLLRFVNDPATLAETATAPERQAWKCDPYAHQSDHYSTLAGLATDKDQLATTCIARLHESGLAGMGGAGFPTGRKWDLVRQTTDDTKFVICNADESGTGYL